MEIVGLTGLVLIIYKLVDFLKFVTSKDVNSAVTQLSVWLSAFAVALLAREAEPFSDIGVVGTTFGELSTAAIVLFALGLGSTASAVYDAKRAVDDSDTAATPPLLPATPHQDTHDVHQQVR